MSAPNETIGRVYHETHGHVMKIVIDNTAKKNSFSPEMMAQLSEAMTLLDKDENLWVGVLCAVGDDFTAGLDMPKFFGPKATVKPRPEGNIDPFGLANRCRKPLVTAVQGICFTVASKSPSRATSSLRRIRCVSARWNRSVASRPWAAPTSDI